MRYLLPLILAVMLFPLQARSEWISSQGTYLFGPEMSENDACQKAERRAKEKALKEVTGEKISSEDNMVCSEMKDNAECSLNRFTWSTIDGLIRKTRNKEVNIVSSVGGYKECRVSMDVDVGVGTGAPDPGFDISVRLNRSTFRDGESLRISLSPTQPMYVSIFQYLPYDKAERQVTRIFPNIFDEASLFDKPGTVPTPEGSRKYDMRIGFPKGLNQARDLVDEYLMVVGTRNSITFRDTYSLEEFNSILLEIPLRDRRIERKAYNVVRPK